MNSILQQLKKDRLMLSGLILFILLVFGIAIIVLRKGKEMPLDETVSEVITLTPEEEAELLKNMTPPPDAKPTLSDKEQEALVESMTPPADAKPTLSEDEMQKLLQSMSPQ